MKTRNGIYCVLIFLLAGSVLFTLYAGIRLLTVRKIYMDAAENYSDLSEQFISMEKEASSDAEEAPVHVDFSSFQKDCPYGTAVGWLYCDDEVINYPVMYCENNEFFLHHLPDGSPSACGTLFLDCRNAEDLSDFNSLIYGHHMSDGSMFGSLSKYRRKEYAEEHPIMWLITPQKCLKLHFEGCYVTSTESPAFRTFFPSRKEQQEFLDHSASSFLFPGEAPLRLDTGYISLVTCSYESNNVRQITLFSID